MTSIERKLQRRNTLREKLDDIVRNVEEGLRSGHLTTQMDMTISLERIEFLFRQIQKLDEDIYLDTTDDLVTAETSEEATFNDKIVHIMAELRFRFRDHPSGESGITPPQTRSPHSGTVATRAKLPTRELTKFDGD